MIAEEGWTNRRTRWIDRILLALLYLGSERILNWPVSVLLSVLQSVSWKANVEELMQMWRTWCKCGGLDGHFGVDSFDFKGWQMVNYRVSIECVRMCRFGPPGNAIGPEAVNVVWDCWNTLSAGYCSTGGRVWGRVRTCSFGFGADGQHLVAAQSEGRCSRYGLYQVEQPTSCHAAYRLAQQKCAEKKSSPAEQVGKDIF